MRTGRSGYVCARANRGAACTAIAADARCRNRRRGSRMDASLARSGGPLLAFDLGAMHDPTAARVESVAAVHRAAIVPQNQVADAPHVLPGKFRPIDEIPEFVEQRLRFGKR